MANIIEVAKWLDGGGTARLDHWIAGLEVVLKNYRIAYHYQGNYGMGITIADHLRTDWILLPKETT